ncbi:MAG: hypothetical protein GY696_25010, partial [Gammaproteobacteria bacterium]|nr:hypothetical protein [Gammaproteobacteria bacterium]
MSSTVSTRGIPGAPALPHVEEEPEAEPSRSHNNQKMEARLVLIPLTKEIATHRTVKLSLTVSTRGIPGAAALPNVEEEPEAEPSRSYNSRKMEARNVLLPLTKKTATPRVVPSTVSTRGIPGTAALSNVEEEPEAEPSRSHNNQK